MSQDTEFIKMERKFFESQIAALSLNFRQKVDMKTVDLYWEHFKGVNRNDFTNALLSLLDKEEHFPNIATIRKYFPKTYPDYKENWPEFKDLDRSRKTGIGRDCLDLIFKKLTGKMTKEEYYQGVLDLERKYPGQNPFSFRQSAEYYIQSRIYEGI